MAWMKQLMMNCSKNLDSCMSHCSRSLLKRFRIWPVEVVSKNVVHVAPNLHHDHVERGKADQHQEHEYAEAHILIDCYLQIHTTPLLCPHCEQSIDLDTHQLRHQEKYESKHCDKTT
jgi:hypothetical protein